MAEFTNQATLSYKNLKVNSNTVTGEVVDVLAITLTAVRSTYHPNDTVTYIAKINNSGDVEYTDLTYTDNMGETTFGTGKIYPLNHVPGSIKYYKDETLQTAPTVTDGPPMVVTGITVPALGSATLVYEARITEFASHGTTGSIVNTGTVTGGIKEIFDTETITAAAEPMLDITKAVSPATVIDNGLLTYTFTIENYGNTGAVASDNVSISDTFDPKLAGVKAVLGTTDWVLTQDYNYNESSGVFTSVAGKILVDPATYEQNTATGVWTIKPGVATLVITGKV